ncbi:MAG: hypothetical protein ACXVAF_00645 [Vulcanimicrobiaceae bacterium]
MAPSLQIVHKTGKRSAHDRSLDVSEGRFTISCRRLWHGTVLGEHDVVMRLHDWCLIRHKKDPLKDILAYGASRGGSTPFCVQLPAPETLETALMPIEAVFELETRHIGFNHSIAFRWQHREGFPLPSIGGTITARRFGPLVAVTVLGEYVKSTDAAGTLFDEALGNGLARNILREALRAVCYILKKARIAGG